MTDKDRSALLTSKARAAILVSILVIIVGALLLVRGRHPKAIESMQLATSVPAHHPAGTQHSVIQPPSANSTGFAEVCGYGQVKIDKTDDGAINQQVGALTKAAGTRWLSALQNSSDLRARVAGLLLEGKVTGGDSLRPVTEQTRSEVVQLAAGAQDPAVYAMALSMCGPSAATDADGACPQLSLQRWARMDADNAVPWLLLAGKARAGHDSAAEAHAFNHAATAHKIDAYSDSVFAFAEPELPRDVTPLERSYLATEVIGVEAATGLSHYSVASQHCSSEAMRDSTVRQQCDVLAELLVTKGTNLLDLGVGKTIGERAGWPGERVKKLAREQHALMQAIILQSPSDNDQLWTCYAVSGMNAYVIQRARLGELGAARVMLARSGETTEAMAQAYTQHIDDIVLDALRQQQQNSAQAAQ